MRITAVLLTFGVFLFGGFCTEAETVRIVADRDATLIEHPEGVWANGSGPFAFAGRTSQSIGSKRRLLLRFDVAGALPDHASIERVSLTLYATSGNPAPRMTSLHRVLADWAEGPSSASGGGGSPTEPGDTTWIHREFDDTLWAKPGGHFVARASARGRVTANDFQTWSDTRQLRHDVLLWNAAPSRNFGWILLGDETEGQTAKRFASRESPDPANRPVLEIEFSVSRSSGQR